MNTSVQGYIRGSISENTIAIGNTAMLPILSRMYGQFGDPSQTVNANEANFSTPPYFFSASKVAAFASVTGVTGVDPRICLLQNFQEVPGVTCDDETGECTEIGANREGVAVLMGINSSMTQTKFFGSNSMVAPDDNTSVTVGDSIMYNYFDNISEEEIGVCNQVLNMSGVVEDTLYNGQSIYMGIGALWQFYPELNELYNLIFVQVTPDQYTNAVQTLNTFAQSQLGPSFGALGLRNVVQADEASLNGVYGYFILLDVALLGIACVTLLEYQRGASVSKAHDLFIMRSIGAKRGFLLKSIYWEIALLILPSVGLALGCSMLIVEFGFMSNLTLLPSLWIPMALAGALLGILFLLNIAIARIIFRRARGIPANQL
jgi:ABC-type antimicrobial peptide transport system permease subunit